MYSLLFLIAIALIPAVGVLTILGYIGLGVYGGIFCAIEGYKHNIGRGIISIWISIRKCDYQTNKWIFDCYYSCIPDCNDNCLKKGNPKLVENEEKKNVELEKKSNEKDFSTDNIKVNKTEENQDNNILNIEDNKDNSVLKEEENKENNNNLREEENQHDNNLNIEDNI